MSEEYTARAYILPRLVEVLPGLAPLEVLLLEAAQDHGDGTGRVLPQQLQDLRSVNRDTSRQGVTIQW